MEITRNVFHFRFQLCWVHGSLNFFPSCIQWSHLWGTIIILFSILLQTQNLNFAISSECDITLPLWIRANDQDHSECGALNSSLVMSLGAGAWRVSGWPDTTSREEVSMTTLEAGTTRKAATNRHRHTEKFSGDTYPWEYLPENRESLSSSFDEPWSKLSWISDPTPDHPRELYRMLIWPHTVKPGLMATPLREYVHI